MIWKATGLMLFGAMAAVFAVEGRTGEDRKVTESRKTGERKAQEDRKTGETQTTGRTEENKFAAEVKNILDDQFLVKAFAAGHKEIQLGRLADKNAKNAKVREFGQQMVQDHTKANEQLAKLLEKRKLAVVAGTEKEAREAYDRLSKLQGDEFDRGYMREMVGDHYKAVALFKNQSEHGKEGDISQFAKDTLPTLQKHLQHATNVAREVGVTAGDAGTREQPK
jgi:putative membrane protein